MPDVGKGSESILSSSAVRYMFVFLHQVTSVPGQLLHMLEEGKCCMNSALIA